MRTDKEKIEISIIAFITGVVFTFIIYPKAETETVHKFTTKTETDTVFIQNIDTVYISKKEITTEYLRDTILVDYKPSINKFSTSAPFQYGNTYVSGEVLGEVLKIDITNDFKIPVVTNIITNTETKTIIEKPKGFYVGASINNLLHPGAKVSYLDNKYMFDYQYQPMQRIHQIGVSKKIF